MTYHGCNPHTYRNKPRIKVLGRYLSKSHEHAGSPQKQSPQSCTVHDTDTSSAVSMARIDGAVGLWALVSSHMYQFGSLSCYLLGPFTPPPTCPTAQPHADTGLSVRIVWPCGIDGDNNSTTISAKNKPIITIRMCTKDCQYGQPAVMYNANESNRNIRANIGRESALRRVCC